LMSEGAIATCFDMAGLPAGAVFFAVCALAAPAAIAMADVTAMSVVRTVNIGVSLLNENEVAAANYTSRVDSRAHSTVPREAIPRSATV
jgi:hypothetical protein